MEEGAAVAVVDVVVVVVDEELEMGMSSAIRFHCNREVILMKNLRIPMTT